MNSFLNYNIKIWFIFRVELECYMHVQPCIGEIHTQIYRKLVRIRWKYVEKYTQRVTLSQTHVDLVNLASGRKNHRRAIPATMTAMAMAPYGNGLRRGSWGDPITQRQVAGKLRKLPATGGDDDSDYARRVFL